MSDLDTVRRFALPSGAVRGQWVRLGPAWLALREHTNYPVPVRDLLGQAVVASVLLASSFKFQGILTLQLQGSGAVRLLVAQCTDSFGLRGVARYDAARVVDDFEQLVGDGQLLVTVDNAMNSAARYQGIVPLRGQNLAQALEHYFENSEQLATRLLLASEASIAGGLLLQKMPLSGGVAVQGDDVWERVCAAQGLISASEVLRLDPAPLAQRCAAGEDVRLHASQALRFECRCSLERVSGMLRSLGAEELHDILREQGSVTVTCEFCQRPYRFDPVDVGQLLQSGDVAPAPSTRVN